MPKFSLMDALELAPLIIKTVKGVQGAFGNKPGAERKQHATDALVSGLGISEILSDDTISHEMKMRAANLLSQSIELGLQAVKIEKQINAVWAEIQAIRATSKASA